MRMKKFLTIIFVLSIIILLVDHSYARVRQGKKRDPTIMLPPSHRKEANNNPTNKKYNKREEEKDTDIQTIFKKDERVFHFVNPADYKKQSLITAFKGKTLSDSFETATSDLKAMNKAVQPLNIDDVSQLVRSDEIDPAKRYNFHPKFRMHINVITYNRPNSLTRLLTSLHKARYFGHTINLNIYVENGADQDTRNLVKSFEWAHGPKKIYMRYIKAGLVPAIIESWYPSNEHEYVLLAEDDIEVSEYWYLWILENLRQYRYPMMNVKTGKPFELDPNIFGISLYIPRESENSIPRFMYYPDKHFNSTTWLHQIPCSWGAVYFPEHWQFYRQYIELRQKLNKNVYIPQCECNYWTGSWVKFYTELAYLKGWYMVYPNHKNQMSYSTNHLEPGVHIQVDETKHKKEAFTVPIVTENIVPVGKLDDINEIPILDYKYQRYQRREEIQQAPKYSWKKFLIELHEKEKQFGSR